jgi:pimeloyl-ACP methyl ester carboxylesterase
VVPRRFLSSPWLSQYKIMGQSISHLVFQPPRVTYLQTNSSFLWLTTKTNVTVPAFYIDRKSKVTVLFSHGNAEDLGMFYEAFCDFSRELRVNVLAYDYEGYGKAGGTPSEQGCYDCIDAAYQFLTDKLRIPSDQIVLYGRSIGSGPSCYLAEKLHQQGKVLGGMILLVSLRLYQQVAVSID